MWVCAGPLELELWVAWSCWVGVGNQAWVFVRAVHCLHAESSPQPLCGSHENPAPSSLDSFVHSTAQEDLKATLLPALLL